MTTMTQPAAPFAETRHHPVTTALLVVLFWAAAAVVVASSHIELDPLSPAAGAVVTLAAIVIAAYCYTRFRGRQPDITHALGVGIAWLMLAIISEIAMTTHLGHGWYALLGSPDRPLLRNIFLFVWIFAPAFFARREDKK